ncbi:hypothetical protein JZ751_014739 [Albula glossodonta]|uniref:Transmembrane protein 110 n=1 Tax=Albula glossodonta TaxID=121402 RepID=A0A8T2N2H6_9TELE|nr:hypothetical protein JZ751_014739 [Albula glossodonta]
MMDIGIKMFSRAGDGVAHNSVVAAVSPHNSSLSISPTSDARYRGCKNGALMDSFGIFLQGLLAVVAFSTLMFAILSNPFIYMGFRLCTAASTKKKFKVLSLSLGSYGHEAEFTRSTQAITSLPLTGSTVKRFREPKHERRPWRIWFLDTSKQAIGMLFIHFANVYLSDLTEEDPCSLYLINFLLDASLGMLLIYAGVRAVSALVEWRQWDSLRFGEYGEPLQCSAWVGQCALYILIMMFEKVLIILVLLIPQWKQVREAPGPQGRGGRKGTPKSVLSSYILVSNQRLHLALLNPISNPELELAIVMLIVPFFVNALMFWVVDNFLMRKGRTKAKLEEREGGDNSRGTSKVRYRRALSHDESESEILISADDEMDESDIEEDMRRLTSLKPIKKKKHRLGLPV